MSREIAFAVVLAVCGAWFSVGVGLLIGLGPALMTGSVLVAAWSWLAFSDEASTGGEEE